MEHADLPRRRAPLWIRETSSRALHGIALRMLRNQHTYDWTEKQEWLFSAVVSELEYRARQERRKRRGKPCVCELCLPPFPESDGREMPF